MMIIMINPKNRLCACGTKYAGSLACHPTAEVYMVMSNQLHHPMHHDTLHDPYPDWSVWYRLLFPALDSRFPPDLHLSMTCDDGNHRPLHYY